MYVSSILVLYIDLLHVLNKLHGACFTELQLSGVVLVCEMLSLYHATEKRITLCWVRFL